MNKIIIANYRETEPQVISREGNSFAVKPVIREADAGKCAASFVEVEPGRYAYGYHYHEVNEEVFYIIRGHAVVRTPEGCDCIPRQPGGSTCYPQRIRYGKAGLSGCRHSPDA